MHPDFIRRFLGKKYDAHSRLFERIPSVGDLQAALLLLLYCAAAKPNFLLRTVSPAFTSAYAGQHDFQMWSCLSRVLGGTCPECAAQPIGAVGQIACQCCRSATLTSVGGLLELSPDMSRCPSCMQFWRVSAKCGWQGWMRLFGTNSLKRCWWMLTMSLNPTSDDVDGKRRRLELLTTGSSPRSFGQLC